MSILPDLTFAAAHRETLMPDTGMAVRPAEVSQTPELDENGNPVPGDAETIYEGPCTILDPRAAVLTGRTTNDESGVPHVRHLKVPHRADLRPGDFFTVTAARYSPGMVGDTFVVLQEMERSIALTRLFEIQGSSWRPPV